MVCQFRSVCSSSANTGGGAGELVWRGGGMGECVRCTHGPLLLLQGVSFKS